MANQTSIDDHEKILKKPGVQGYKWCENHESMTKKQWEQRIIFKYEKRLDGGSTISFGQKHY